MRSIQDMGSSDQKMFFACFWLLSYNVRKRLKLIRSTSTACKATVCFTLCVLSVGAVCYPQGRIQEDSAAIPMSVLTTQKTTELIGSETLLLTLPGNYSLSQETLFYLVTVTLKYMSMFPIKPY